MWIRILVIWNWSIQNNTTVKGNELSHWNIDSTNAKTDLYSSMQQHFANPSTWLKYWKFFFITFLSAQIVHEDTKNKSRKRSTLYRPFHINLPILCSHSLGFCRDFVRQKLEKSKSQLKILIISRINDHSKIVQLGFLRKKIVDLKIIKLILVQLLFQFFS